MKKFSKKLIAIVLSVAILSGLAVFAADKKEDVNKAWYNALFFGAIPNDGVDDTGAIKQALSGGTLYLPEGEYIIKETLALGKLVGAGSDKTIITADFEDPMKPILNTSRTAFVEGVTIRFKEGLVTGEETEGQRLGINTSGRFSTQRGTRFTDVVVENVGTGIASGIAKSVLGREEDEDQFFSVTMDKFTVKDFSFRGFDFRSGARTGNYFKDITLISGKYRADSAVYWTGEESETAIGKMTIKDTIAETPMYLTRLHGLSADEIIFDNVYALHYPLITLESSVMSVDKLTFDYSDVHFGENPLILIDKSQYILANIQTLNGLHIGTLKLNSFNSANAKMIFKRSPDVTDPFYITVDEYVVTNSDYDWFNFPTSEENLSITKKGAIATEGPTSDRPEQCLCPYYSKYYDTDLNKTVVWTGEEWK